MKKWTFTAALTLALSGFGLGAFMVNQQAVAQSYGGYNLETIVDGLDSPWGLAILPDGDMLITELTGDLRHIRNGKLVTQAVAGVPQSLYGGQGGLMDIVIHPNYEDNRHVYLSLSVGAPGANALRVIRGRFTGTALEDVITIFEAAPSKNTLVHYGARMAFLPDNTLLINVGDGFDLREQAQNLGNHFGSLVRVTDDGKVPQDNPFIGVADAQPEIYSYGHRNQQSIAVDKASGKIYQTEHGPRGGDELNLIEPGKNYGWPIATYGIDYSGARISPYTSYEGTQQPLVDWTPSIGPSGMTIYDGAQFPDWRGDIFVSSLIFNKIIHIDMVDGAPKRQSDMFGEIGDRLRDIRTGADGALYILSEGDNGKLWRVSRR
ncbi:MAG: Aldose sugar dehydrogenase YliI [Alphaproteobacteria bacterium]|nr:MAG: Aldose sugar dehydrogenase YliI [Alphaproteobacteria bacterium]